MEDRTLLYTCCDDQYTHFIPLYCASALFSNDKIDIEIGVNLDRLTDEEEESLKLLREMHPEAKIKIKYNFYNKVGNKAIYNGNKMMPNTVRFVSIPEIKDRYTYIGDVDVVLLMKNFYNYHIGIMERYGTSYSNWVRDNDSKKLTGLHFVKSENFYPQDLSGINLDSVDENILKTIQSRCGKISNEIPRRPICGLHFSKNQRFNVQLKLCKIFMDELKSYDKNFHEFLSSKEYDAVKKCNTSLINTYIEEFTTYYESQRTNS